MNVSACLVTRGDVLMKPIVESLPPEWERVIWNNGTGQVFRASGDVREEFDVADLSVFGRYAAIEYATNDLIFVVDDDVIVSDPQAIVDALFGNTDAVACNMPPQFRPHYEGGADALVGFGAAFHRDAPARAFAHLAAVAPTLGISNYGWWLPGFEGNDHFLRTCDIVFTGLTPTVLVDVPKTDREFASDPDRMWRQPTHVEERQRMRELVQLAQRRKAT